MFEVLGDNPGNMRMALKAATPYKQKQVFHFAIVVDVFREHVLAQWAARRSMHKQIGADFVGVGQMREESLANFVIDAVSGVCELLPRPIDRAAGRNVGSSQVPQDSFVM